MTVNAYLNAGVIMKNFPGKLLPVGCDNDVVNSLLFAQLAVSKDHSAPSSFVERETQIQAWLDSLFWIVSRVGDDEINDTAAFDVLSVATKECEKKFDPAVVTQFVELFSELRTVIPTAKALSLWQDRVVVKSNKPLDGPDECSKVEQSDVCVKFAVLGAGPVFYTLTVSFVTPTVLGSNFLSQNIVADVNGGVAIEAKSYVLNEHGYIKVRKEISEKVKDKKKNFLMPWGAI